MVWLCCKPSRLRDHRYAQALNSVELHQAVTYFGQASSLDQMRLPHPKTPRQRSGADPPGRLWPLVCVDPESLARTVSWRNYPRCALQGFDEGFHSPVGNSIWLLRGRVFASVRQASRSCCWPNPEIGERHCCRRSNAPQGSPHDVLAQLGRDIKAGWLAPWPAPHEARHGRVSWRAWFTPA